MIASYDRVTSWVDEVRAEDVFYNSRYSTTLNTVFLAEKLRKHGLDEWIVRELNERQSSECCDQWQILLGGL